MRAWDNDSKMGTHGRTRKLDLYLQILKHYKQCLMRFSQGASLNPDEVAEDEGDFFYNEEEVHRNLLAQEGTALQMPTPEEFNAEVNPGQFHDATAILEWMRR